MGKAPPALLDRFMELALNTGLLLMALSPFCSKWSRLVHTNTTHWISLFSFQNYSLTIKIYDDDDDDDANIWLS